MQEVHDIAASQETARIEVLRQYEILDTPPDFGLDGLTGLAAQIFDVTIALISFVDKDRIWFKGHYGLEEQESPMESGFCASAILSDELFLVEDATLKAETCAHSLVTGKENIRFYAGMPLRTKEGYNLGAFCILDRKPRILTQTEKDILISFSKLVLNHLELRQEARIAVKHQHQILNTTAHDLKNPLSIMPLLADMIMHHKNDPKAIDDIAQQIKDAGRRMAGVIDGILETAREEAGRVNLRLQAVELASLVSAVVNTNLALARNKKQQLSLKVIQDCRVYADPGKLTEIVDNLINNAIKYSPSETSIYVKVMVKEEFAVVEVKDEGPGLTKDDKKNLYRRFTSLSAQPTGGENSTGLGLSIVKNLVDAHRGFIYATSDGPGTGATFTVELPLSENC